MTKELLNLVTSQDPLEPETLKQFFPELSSMDINKILATKVLLTTNAILEDMDVFENFVYTINNIHPDITKTEGATPELIWKTIDYIKKVRKNAEFSFEVLMYIKYIFNDNGYYFYPPGIGLDDSLLNKIKENLKKKHKLTENFLDIQTYKYLKLMELINAGS